MTSTVSEQTLEAQILEALGNDERFEVGSEKYNLFEPYLPKLLIEAIGSKLDDLVNMQTLCDVTAKLLVLIAESDCFDGLRPLEAPMARQLYISLADQLNEGETTDIAPTLEILHVALLFLPLSGSVLTSIKTNDYTITTFLKQTRANK
jgi:hypothetical protein